MSIEYMERCHIDVGRTVCTLVLVHVWISRCHYDTITIAHSAAIQTHDNGDGTWRTTLHWYWLNACNGVVLALDEQRVR